MKKTYQKFMWISYPGNDFSKKLEDQLPYQRVTKATL